MGGIPLFSAFHYLFSKLSVDANKMLSFRVDKGMICESCGTINTFYLQGDRRQYDFTTTLEKDNIKQNKTKKKKKQQQQQTKQNKIKQNKKQQNKTKEKKSKKKKKKKNSTTMVIPKAAIILHKLKSEPKKLLCVIISNLSEGTKTLGYIAKYTLMQERQPSFPIQYE